MHVPILGWINGTIMAVAVAIGTATARNATTTVFWAAISSCFFEACAWDILPHRATSWCKDTTKTGVVEFPHLWLQYTGIIHMATSTAIKRLIKSWLTLEAKLTCQTKISDVILTVLYFQPAASLRSLIQCCNNAVHVNVWYYCDKWY